MEDCDFHYADEMIGDPRARCHPGSIAAPAMAAATIPGIG
jgi:hypothetical protein